MKDWSERNKEGQLDEWKEKCNCFDVLVKQREINKKLDLSGIPTIFADATVRSFDAEIYKSKESRETAEIAKKAAGNFVKNFHLMKESGKGLYLYSDVKGSGKTRLASSIANALVKMYGVDIAFIKADDLLKQIRKTFQKDSQTTEADIIKAFRDVEVLIIDDIAVEKPTEFAEGTFYNITDYRLENRKITLFTSNKTIEDLTEIYKEGRVKSRIKKMSLEIYMPEESVRDEEAERENSEFEKILFG